MLTHLAPGALLRSVGHWTHPDGLTGCTVVLCERAGSPVSGEVRGAAPGTRETDLLRPGGLVGRAHAILLSGGSAPGLAAADGVVTTLRESGIGFEVALGVPPVPIVPGAVVFDRGALMGVFPDASAGRAACQDALRTPSSARGRVGAGAGASVGKAAGPLRATPAGIGRAAIGAAGVVAEALMAVNAFGELRDPRTGEIIAGAKHENGESFVSTIELLATGSAQAPLNTVIGVVATNLSLDVAALSTFCRMANSGLSRVVTPAHTLFDGDTLFALSLPASPSAPCADPRLLSLAGALAAEAVAAATLDAVAAHPA